MLKRQNIFLLFFLLVGCREMVNHDPLMPRVDKTEAKELAQPANFEPQILSTKKFAEKRAAQTTKDDVSIG